MISRVEHVIAVAVRKVKVPPIFMDLSILARAANIMAEKTQRTKLTHPAAVDEVSGYKSTTSVLHMEIMQLHVREPKPDITSTAANGCFSPMHQPNVTKPALEMNIGM